MRSSAVRSARRAPRVGPVWGDAPAIQLLVSASVALGALMLLGYLVLRMLEGGSEALSLWTRARTLELTLSTLALGIGVIVGAVSLGVPLAWLTTRTDLPARRWWSVLAIAPLAIPSYLLAFAYVSSVAPRGWVSSILGPLGVTGIPGSYGFGGAVLVLTLATTPYVVIGTRAALIRLDPSVEEAARSLGRGPLGAARTAVVPVILPAVGAGALLACLYAIADFGAVSILRYDTLATAIYSQYRLSFDRSGAAALAVLLLVLSLVLVWAEGRVRRKAALATPHGRTRVGHPVRLGRWRWPALAFCTTVAGLSLGIPGITISTWLIDGIWRDAPLQLAVDALRDAVVLAAVAASLALFLAIPLARLVSYHPGRWSAFTGRLLYAVYAIPGITLALAIVSLTLQAIPMLYQSLLILAAAMALRYLVQPVGALHGPMLQISPRTMEAARSLGEGGLGVLRTITLPLLRPGLAAGFMLVLISALKELPLTLLLAPPGFSTLATRVWDAARESFYAQAAVPAALLLMVSFVSVGLLVRRGEIEA